MIGTRLRTSVAVLMAAVAVTLCAPAPPASALNLIKPICTVAGLVSGLVGKACSAAQHGDRVISAGKNLLSGHVGGAVKSLVGDGSSGIASKATTALALAAIGTWVVGGASFVLHQTASVLSRTTDPQLTTTWFSATYWRVAGIAAVLTLPFLFAAAIQAILQSDLTLLSRAALGYLPLALLAVTIAAPLTMLLLSASDEMAAVVSSAAGHQSANFLKLAGAAIGLLTLASRSPFLSFFVGLLTVAAGFALWLELMMRAAAVYVIVLMLPLTFAAFVWPARRVWAIRLVELLLALILSKFVIVAVLSLGGAAFTQSVMHSIAGMVAGVALLALGAFAPWAVLRLLPVTELASAAAGSLRPDRKPAVDAAGRADGQANEAELWATKAAQMRREAQDTEGLDGAHAAKDGLAVPAASTDTDRAADAPAAQDGAAAAPAAASVAAASRRVGTESESAHEDVPTERIPGLPEIWQAKNGTWNPVILGPDLSQVGPPIEDPGNGASRVDAAPADDPDPSPPRQDPQEGHL